MIVCTSKYYYYLVFRHLLKHYQHLVMEHKTPLQPLHRVKAHNHHHLRDARSPSIPHHHRRQRTDRSSQPPVTPRSRAWTTLVLGPITTAPGPNPTAVTSPRPVKKRPTGC